MRKFDLGEAKAGAPVCTREGRPARIICWDWGKKYPITALVKYRGQEYLYKCDKNGYRINENEADGNDLMMVDCDSEHEGWVNIYKSGSTYKVSNVIYTTKGNALRSVYANSNLVDTTRITWEE